MQIKSYYGNIALIELNKTAFLCSRQVPASAVLKCYDWATEKRKQGTCVISGFHSQLEKDVLHFLIKGNQVHSTSKCNFIVNRFIESFKTSKNIQMDN